jgi:hypothetical protein
MKNNTEVLVSVKPKCDFCDKTAEYDIKTNMGSWANVCKLHYSVYGGELGLGKGQKLILENDDKKLKKVLK